MSASMLRLASKRVAPVVRRSATTSAPTLARSIFSRPLFAARTLPRPTLLRRTPTLARSITDQARAELDKMVKGAPLVLFMKGTPQVPQCGFSRAVVQVLDLHDVPPEKVHTYNILEDEELRNDIKEYSEWPTIPQVYVNGEFVGGCDIIISMHQSGQLAELLAQHGLTNAPKEAEVVEPEKQSS